MWRAGYWNRSANA
ncbi:MAG: hypothetical protein KKH41_04840 [Candidatus Thermoplasmatota archaeon]|nr:hypothetical protein [Euryarchaeota archaeon]MBU4031702.1 hypothetical protein [Candidatus Thermoplasmatota archaeon]MBU4070659.1 hypothetical protein [Candidatus Thermoplasmatota archaeon]MBU4143992.1 hypothetical protein [Candidatus Thermoplasmatota archaeon]MBU4591894.1 hypothetical protein [Candidatus Thermoplasmatota archaeon]